MKVLLVLVHDCGDVRVEEKREREKTRDTNEAWMLQREMNIISMVVVVVVEVDTANHQR